LKESLGIMVGVLAMVIGGQVFKMWNQPLAMQGKAV
jgi:hypothetical protein